MFMRMALMNARNGVAPGRLCHHIRFMRFMY
jgi:hypothetical protein